MSKKEIKGSAKKILIAGKHEEFWVEVSSHLKADGMADTLFWVGGVQKDLPKGGDYTFYNAWQSFSLANAEKYLAEDEWEIPTIEDIAAVDYVGYLKILDRIDFRGNFSFSERNLQVWRQLGFWLGVLRKHQIESVIFADRPHGIHFFPLYICAKTLGLKIVILNRTPTPGFLFFTRRVEGAPINLSKGSQITALEKKTFLSKVDRLKLGSSHSPAHMERRRKLEQNASRLRNKIRFSLPAVIFEGVIRTLGLYGNPIASDRTRSVKSDSSAYSFPVKNAIWEIIQLRKWERDKAILKRSHDKCVSKVPEREFIFFALSYQPEATTMPYGGFYADQVACINMISKALGDKYAIVIKEHPSQFRKTLFGNFGRFKSFWKTLTQMPNVYLAPLSSDTADLIKDSVAVVTVTGSVGWEAVSHGKKCFYFGHPWYSGCEGSFKIDSGNAKEILNRELHEKQDNLVHFSNDDFLENLANKVVYNDILGAFSGAVPRSPRALAVVLKEFL